jgi:hypothetical protein
LHFPLSESLNTGLTVCNLAIQVSFLKSFVDLTKFIFSETGHLGLRVGISEKIQEMTTQGPFIPPKKMLKFF